MQEILLRVVRDLPSLRSPERFRPWLVTIAMRPISGAGAARWQDRELTAPLEAAEDRPDGDADFVDVAILRLDLSGQRRQVAEAGRWLDPDDRRLLSLWWLEVAGELTRADVTAALGLGAAHTRVRLQRMRRQLELSRHIVVALQVEPRCPGIEDARAGWDGQPGPRWRKRFARHVRDCARCASRRSGLVATERLLAGVALVPVPARLGSVVTGGGLIPGAVGTGATTAASGRAAASTIRPSAPRPSAPGRAGAKPAPDVPGASRPAPSASSSAGSALGHRVLRAAGRPGGHVARRAGRLVRNPLPPPGTGSARRDATFHLVAGLADPACRSLRASDGRYGRHSSFRLVLAVADDTPLLEMDATYCPRHDDRRGVTRFESFNYPGRFVRHDGGEIRLDTDDGAAAFRAASSFLLTRRRPASSPAVRHAPVPWCR